MSGDGSLEERKFIVSIPIEVRVRADDTFNGARVNVVLSLSKKDMKIKMRRNQFHSQRHIYTAEPLNMYGCVEVKLLVHESNGSKLALKILRFFSGEESILVSRK